MIPRDKKKIMWLCNARFSDERIRTTASWLQPLAELLQQSGKVDIVNVTVGKVDTVEREFLGKIEQYVIPLPQTSHHGQIPSREFCHTLSTIEDRVSPDLVHVWGSEGIWASACLLGAIKSKAFMDMQGLLSSSYYYYYGGLSLTDIIKSIHLKELLMPWRALPHKKEVFKLRGRVESEALRHFKYISYQSEWVRNHLSFIVPEDTQFLKTRIMLRKSFYEAEAWTYKGNMSVPTVFTTASGAIPYKGIQILMHSIALLKRKYPDIKLHVAGNMNIGNRLQDGFSIYLHKLIKSLDIEDNVVCLGPIDETQIVKELQLADVCVIPSFVETYCLAFAESMIVGTPTVTSFAGAMPELARHGEECLFYNSIDFQTCASYVDRLICDRELAEHISCNARKRRLLENDPQRVVDTQLDIYVRLLSAGPVENVGGGKMS